MEVWLAEYRLAKAGKATDKSLRLLNDFDIFDHVEKLLSGGAELGKRGRGDDGDQHVRCGQERCPFA